MSESCKRLRSIVAKESISGMGTRDTVREAADEIEQLREIIRSLRQQLLAEHFRGLNPSPTEVDSTAREWDAETERLIEAAWAAERE